jgi:hypothetical protein
MAGAGLRSALMRGVLSGGCVMAIAAGGALAQAQAASISIAQRCIVDAPSAGAVGKMTVNGQGFTPGDTVDVSGGGVFATATVAANGTFTTTTGGPQTSFIGPGVRAFTLQAMGEMGGQTATAKGLVTNLAASARPGHAKPGHKVHWFFSGLRSGREVFGHYLIAHGRRLRVFRTIRFGRAHGPCGVLRTRQVLVPGKRVRNFTVQIDDSRRYRADALPRLLLKITKIFS